MDTFLLFEQIDDYVDEYDPSWFDEDDDEL